MGECVKLEIVRVDYLNKKQAKDMSFLLDEYAKDPMGGGEPLGVYTKTNLARKLADLPHAFSVMAYVDQQAVGLINCFEAFSTFKCAPLVNIHDITVLNDYRGLGISQRMLQEVETIAIEKSCCKITLEVLDGNTAARNAYMKFGFEGYELDPKMGKALFWQKNIK